MTAYLPRDRVDARRRLSLAARNARFGDWAEALAILEGDATPEAEKLRQAIGEEMAAFAARRAAGGDEERSP